MKKNGRDLKVTLLLANSFQVSKLYKKAIDSYLKVLDLDARNIIALNNLAWLYQIEKNPKALQYAERAYNQAPNNPAVADTYGWLLVNTGNLNKGITIIQQASVQAPQLFDIRYHLAFALHKSGREKEARKELERLLKKTTNFSESEAAKKLLKQLQQEEG